MPIKRVKNHLYPLIKILSFLCLFIANIAYGQPQCSYLFVKKPSNSQILILTEQIIDFIRKDKEIWSIYLEHISYDRNVYLVQFFETHRTDRIKMSEVYDLYRVSNTITKDETKKLIESGYFNREYSNTDDRIRFLVPTQKTIDYLDFRSANLNNSTQYGIRHRILVWKRIFDNLPFNLETLFLRVYQSHSRGEEPIKMSIAKSLITDIKSDTVQRDLILQAEKLGLLKRKFSEKDDRVRYIELQAILSTMIEEYIRVLSQE